jgi:hypothetical protein
MFEKASRLKLRFDTTKGQLSAEDLWDLPLTSQTGKANLDDLAKDLFRTLKNEGETISFVTPVGGSDRTVQLKFDIVKHVIDVRVAERDEAAQAASKRDQKQRILEVIAQKENEALLGSSLEDLRRMAESL